MSWEATNWARQAVATGVLKCGEGFVLVLLADHADELWSCFPSQERLARDSAQTERSVRRHLARLEELGLITVEARYGEGRGRVGSRYRLHEKALQALAARGPEPESANREIARPDNLSGKSANREITRPDNLSGKSKIREITRLDNLSGKSDSPDNRDDSPDIHDDSPDNRDFAHIEDRARMNHQKNHQSIHQSGAAAEIPAPDGQTDEDGSVQARMSGGAAAPSPDPEPDDPSVYRGVELTGLRLRVPAVSDLTPEQVRIIVDIVLARASGPVKVPTSYVARAMVQEFHMLVSAARQVEHDRRIHQEAPPVPRAGEPCHDPDVHVPAYGRRVLEDCPYCRVEARSVPRPMAASGR